VGDLGDRRAAKKAQTREHIRSVAHDLFERHGFDSVTIADIARTADVAVQTVFNHFPTKEELFFDGRVHWMEWPARAVRTRDAATPPLTALRLALLDLTGQLLGSHGTPQRRNYVATLLGSETLRAQERELVHEAESLLTSALVEAWSDSAEETPRPADPAAVAPLVAAIWISAVRVLIHERRTRLSAGGCPLAAATEATDLADRVLRQLEESVALTYARPTSRSVQDTGWPADPVRRAG
jgi:AcrR family transcriptional regulator